MNSKRFDNELWFPMGVEQNRKREKRERENRNWKLNEIPNDCLNFSFDYYLFAERFPWAGQNVGMDIDSETYPNVTQSFYRTIFNWFNEYQNADSNIIEAYRVPARNR